MIERLLYQKIDLNNFPPSSYLKYLFLGIIKLDNNPAFESEAAIWLDQKGLTHIYAYVHPNEETWFSQFCQLLNTQEFAPFISSIEIKGPDMGTNKTRLFDLYELLTNTEIQFTHLTEFEIEQTQNYHQNISVITYNDFFDDNGAGGKILDKMPNLLSLTLPSTPNFDFFNRSHHPLQSLSLQAGYDHQGFISHLAHASCFPQLEYLEWTNGPGLPMIASYVPLAHFEQLQKSSFYDFKEINIHKFQTISSSKEII